MQDARFESGLDNSPMYDAGSCDKAKGATAMCGAWNCSASGKCGDFKDGKMQLYDVGACALLPLNPSSVRQIFPDPPPVSDDQTPDNARHGLDAYYGHRRARSARARNRCDFPTLFAHIATCRCAGPSDTRMT
jgi:hypothetical protein